MYKQRTRPDEENVWRQGRQRGSDHHGGPNELKLKRYWDLRSQDYDEETGIGAGFYRGIVEYLLHEGVFVRGDTVLDVGCGPGPYSLLFAEMARSVTGLDLSDNMLSKMAESARASGRDNVSTLCSSWERYDGGRKFDLVFSSFCPAINDSGALRKMEESSGRSCCCVTSGDIGQESLADMLWGLLDGDHVERKPPDPLYLFNLLYYSGRLPSLRFFEYESSIAVPAVRLVENFTTYFGMYMEMDAHKKRKVSDFIGTLARKGVYRKSGTDTACVVCWNVR